MRSSDGALVETAGGEKGPDFSTEQESAPGPRQQDDKRIGFPKLGQKWDKNGTYPMAKWPD